MQTAFAVQPAAFGSFDEWGCDWATDIDHAYRLAAILGEEDVRRLEIAMDDTQVVCGFQRAQGFDGDPPK